MEFFEALRSWYGLALAAMAGLFVVWVRSRGRGGLLLGASSPHVGTPSPAEPVSQRKGMPATLGRDWGTGNDCLAACMKCGKPMVFFLPKGQIRGQRPQAIANFRCLKCGFEHYATTSVGERATLSTRCELRDNGMFLGQVAELDFPPPECPGGFTGGTRAPFKVLAIGTGPDGNAKLLTEEDVDNLLRNLGQG